MTLPSRARLLAVLPVVVALLAVPTALSPAASRAGRPAGVMAEGPRAALVDHPTAAAPSARLPPPAARLAIVAAPAPRPAPVVSRRPAPEVASRSTRKTAAPAPSAYAPGWEARRGEAALERITYPWQHLGWQISFHEARPGVLGLAYAPERHIYVFVRRDQSEAHLAFTIAHEIGHAFDFTYGEPQRRAEWRRLRAIDPETSWFGCEGCDDLATPAGDLAEVFAVWQVGAVDFRSRLGSLPRGEELRQLGRYFGGP